MENSNNQLQNMTIYSLEDITSRLGISFSEEHGEVTNAFTEAMAEISGVKKDSSNIFFKSSYTSLDAIIVAIRPVLAKYGLLFTQNLFTFKDNTSQLGSVGVESSILHKSGQWIRYGVSTLPITVGKGQTVLHAVGSATTYLRRYQISAVFGITDSKYDDDGNMTGGYNPQYDATPITAEQVEAIKKLALSKELNEMQLTQYITSSFQVADLNALNTTQYSQLVSAIQSYQAPQEQAVNNQ